MLGSIYASVYCLVSMVNAGQINTGEALLMIVHKEIAVPVISIGKAAAQLVRRHNYDEGVANQPHRED